VALCASAQEEKNFLSVSSSILELFNSKQWDKLIATGENALDNGMDDFYLRLRIGIAYYNKGEYISAANQFENALSFNSADESALEYLYYSYVFSNRAAQANHLQGQMTENLRARLKISGPKFFDSLYAEGGTITGNSTTQDGTVGSRAAPASYGEFDRQSDLTYCYAGFRNWIGNNISLYYGYSGTSQNVTKQIFSFHSFASENYVINQAQYYVSPSWQVGRNTRITAAYNSINESFTTMGAQYNPGTDQYVFTSISSTTQLNDYVEFLSISQDLGLWTGSLFGSYSQFGGHKQNQQGLELVFFPSGNNDVYLNGTLTKFSETDNPVSGSRVIYDQVIGIKLAKFLWVEGDATFGRLRNYNEKNAFVVYNLGDDIKSKTEVALLFYFGAVDLSLRFQYFDKEASYEIDNDNKAVGTKIRTADYKAESIIGGFKWNF